jgi:superfamily II DNA or RNA helicase
MSLEPGKRVRSVHDPAKLGMVTAQPPRERPAGKQWQVRWDNQSTSWEWPTALDVVQAEADDDVFALAARGAFGRASDLRRNLTFVHLTGRLANLVYSMGVTNTDFYPHQYRPLLTMLESPSDGLLIADEVGLGKTIEAGLIWTEFRARFDKRRLLVICPAHLREKWRDELTNRFGLKPEILAADEILEALRREPGTHGADAVWIASYQSLRPPSSWSPGQPLEKGDASTRHQLADFLFRHGNAGALFDMVVFDEAHTMRNKETGNWKLGSLIRDVSDKQVMLSATPINLRNDDLFSLLTLLDPDHFTHIDDLRRLINSNRPLVAARDVVLNPRSRACEFIAALEAARLDPVLSQSTQLHRMLEEPPSDDDLLNPSFRAKLAARLETMSLLSHVLTRTRKRDVQIDRVVREVHRESVDMSEPERQLYNFVTETIRRYAWENDLSDGFLLATPQRQVSSSPAALLRAWKQAKRDDDLDDWMSFDDDAEKTRQAFQPLKSYLLREIPPEITLADLERNDSKFARLTRLLNDIRCNDPFEKVVVFTSFRTTARYLVERLVAAGHPSLLVWGDPGRSKYEIIEEFRTNSDVRVLVSTEVAAEGVDLQFSRLVVNFDLPWNPTRVEQRIGRIDRLGQQAKKIFAWNLFFAGTIDDRVVGRLLTRLAGFEAALGETEAVIGEELSRLEYALLSRKLSAEEEGRLIEEAAVRLEQVARQQQELEDNAAHMVAHGQSVLDRISASKDMGRFVTAHDLMVFVIDTLDRRYRGYEYQAEPGNELRGRLQLPPNLAVRLTDWIRTRGAVGQTRLANGRPMNVEFRNAIVSRGTGTIETIHQFHPLISYLAHELRATDEEFYPVAAVEVARTDAGQDLSPGNYAFTIHQVSVTGVYEEDWLLAAVADVESGDLLSDDLADRVVDACRTTGRDWLSAGNDLTPTKVSAALEVGEAAVEARMNELVERKKSDNDDRVRFQLDSIERHEARRCTLLDQVAGKHRREGRAGLAAATEGQKRNFLEKMSLRRAGIAQRQQVHYSSRPVCAGVVRIV